MRRGVDALISRTPLAAGLLLLWAALLAASTWYVQRTLTIGTDLRLFLPDPQTPEQKLLLDEIGEGPASRVLAAAIEGANPEELADASRSLAAALADDERFRLVANGELALESVPEELLPYRYLLSDTLDANKLDADYLRRELISRSQDLGSPAGSFLEPWLPRDPTLELLKIVQRWQPAQEPHRLYDVWFDDEGRRALLLIETTAPAFDPDRQREAIEAIEQAFADVRTSDAMRLTVSGAGAFSVMMEQRTRSEAQSLGTAATLGILILLIAAYRSAGSVILSALPLASAAVAGLVTLTALFGTVHGITLAFGFTLLGIAQDYPVHLMSHQRQGRAPLTTVRELWPTLATGVASTCIAYATFFFSGVSGLTQLAAFTVTGLAVAGLTTRFVLPRLMDASGRDYGQSEWIGWLWRGLQRLPRPRWLAPAIVLISLLTLAFGSAPFWENDLGKLTPVPEDAMARDQALRSHLGTADIRYLLAVESTSNDAALERLEEIEPSLRALIEAGAIEGYDHAARYVPSVARQLQRREALPDEAELRADLDKALTGTPFRTDAFEPFIEDVAQARAAAPLTPETLESSPLSSTLESLLLARDGKTTALVTFSGVAQPEALQQLAASHPDVLLLDLKTESESLVARQRQHLLWSLAAAALLLVGIVSVALRKSDRIRRVLTPMALTILLVTAVLHGSGVSLTLFHLIALILGAGLGLDYALFFEHASDDEPEQRRTLHAVMLCAASTLLVFALLATSGLPLLRAIGLTVTLSVVGNFLLAVAMMRRTVEQSFPRPSSLIPHQGSMCLLDRIVEWDDGRIVLATATHRSPDNPLRMDGRLRAVHLCEYGAQAMAVHGGLRAQAAGTPPQPGMLVSLRAVKFSRDFVEDLAGDLRVEASCLQSSATSLQYEFRITHEGAWLAEGRAAVVLNAQK
jgi:predicted exporter/predicted hotdog family 3-hydroxylacyl-ACP dehydratase